MKPTSVGASLSVFVKLVAFCLTPKGLQKETKVTKKKSSVDEIIASKLALPKFAFFCRCCGYLVEVKAMRMELE
jgi:hypothetical protein